MADIAQIGFKADYRELDKAADSLDGLSTSADKADRSARKLERSTDDLSGSSSRLSRSAGGVGTIFKSLSGFAVGFATSLAAAVGSLIALDRGVTSAREFSKAFAELSTLLPSASRELDRMAESAALLAKEFGTSRAAQISAFYQAVSAGATNAAEAVALVESANRLALGGVTSVESAIDLLTSAVNSYASTGLTAAEASDSLFVAVRQGKTTIPELAASLGQVTALASASGVSFDELTASIATLTAGGIRTAESVTGLKAIIQGIGKPTGDAAKLAKALGLEFNSAALRTKGLSAFLQDLLVKTEGSKDAINALFGSVEALNAIYVLTSQGGETFNANLDAMAGKLGATQEAANKVGQSLDQRLTVSINKISEAVSRAGDSILAYLVPSIEFVVDNFGTLTEAAGIVAASVISIIQPGTFAQFERLGVFSGELATRIKANFVGLAAVIKRAFDDALASVSNTLAGISAVVERAVGGIGQSLGVAGPQGFGQANFRAAQEAGARDGETYAETFNKAFNNFAPKRFAPANFRAAEDASLTAAAAFAASQARANLGETSERMRSILESVKQSNSETKAFKTNVEKLAVETNELATIASGFAKNLVQGFARGESAAKSFGDAASRALTRIGDQLINIGFQNLFKGFGGPSTVNGLFSGLFGFASGGVVKPFARGGVINQPATFPMSGGSVGLAGEAGPEAILPLSRGSGGVLGVRAQSEPVNVHVTVSVDDDGKIQAYVSRMGVRAATQGANAAISQVRQSFPTLLNEAQQFQL